MNNIGAVNTGTLNVYGNVIGNNPGPAPGGSRPPRHRPEGVDALIVTAIAEEYEAVRAIGGLSPWTDHHTDGDAPYATARSASLSVALTRPIRMGGRSVSPIATRLTDQLRPRCLAMCGVCAGNPAYTARGDVIVAAPAYQWDEGKHTEQGFVPEPDQLPLDGRWMRAVQNFDPSSLLSYDAATDDDAAAWLLECLHNGQDPYRHPARKRYFTPDAWATQLTTLESSHLIVWQDGHYALTGKGLNHIQRVLYVNPDGPRRLPFKVRAGAMASGGGVVATSGVWDTLGKHQRKILGLDMEAATIATIANDRKVQHWLVAKGVSDHADPDKDDRFKAFAAKASAEVLLALLERLLATPPPLKPTSRIPDAVRQEITRQLRYFWPDVADVFGVPSYETRRFRAGDEPHELWVWLEQRERLADLPGALAEVGRPDLADVLRPYV